MSEATKGVATGPIGQHNLSAGTTNMKFAGTVCWEYDGKMARCVHGSRENTTWIYEFLKDKWNIMYPYGDKANGWEWNGTILKSCKSGKTLTWSGGDGDGKLTGGSSTWVREGNNWFKDGDKIHSYDSARDDIPFLALVANLL